MPGCNSSNTATLTITGNATDGYSVSPDPATIPQDGCLQIDVPSGGCVICLNNDFGGAGRQIRLSASRTFGPIPGAAGTRWTYTVQAPGTDCPGQAAGVPLTSNHTIQVGSSGGL